MSAGGVIDADEIEQIAARLSRIVERAKVDRSSEREPSAAPTGPAAIHAARHYLDCRRRRSHILPPDMLGEPDWDALLDLFIAEQEGRQISVSSLCMATDVAPTTALRHISRLVERGYITRSPDQADRRRTFVRLAPDLSPKLARWADRLLPK